MNVIMALIDKPLICSRTHDIGSPVHRSRFIKKLTKNPNTGGNMGLIETSNKSGLIMVDANNSWLPLS